MNDILTLRVQEFQEYVQKLHEAGKLVDENVAKMQKFQQQLKKVTFDKARASANAFNKTLHTMNKIIEAIQNKTKTITFMGMGALAGIGAWGQSINKSNSEASAKGLSPRQQHSLKGAARIMGNDENYFVDMYGKLDEARKDWANSSKDFAKLGIQNAQDLQDIKDPRELIHKVVSEIQKNKKEGKLDFKGNAKLIDDSVENLLGVNLQEALSIDVKDFNAKYKDSFNNVTDAELKRMGKMGSEFTSLFETIKSFALSVTSNLAPALSKLFKAVKEGLANFKNSDTFKSIMDSMRKFFDSASGKASGAIKSFFDNLPNLVKRMVLGFSKLEIVFLEIQKALTYIQSGKGAKDRTILDTQIKALEKSLKQQEATLDFEQFLKEKEKGYVSYDISTKIQKNQSLKELIRKDSGDNLVRLMTDNFYKGNTQPIQIINNVNIDKELQTTVTSSQQIQKSLQVGAR